MEGAPAGDERDGAPKGRRGVLRYRRRGANARCLSPSAGGELLKLMSGAVLVTGASGAVGPELIRTLAGEDAPVRALVRSLGNDSLLPRQVERVQGDVADAQAVRRAVDGAFTVFHLAARLHLNDPSPALEEEYRRVNVDGTANLARAAAEAGVRRFVFFSTINVYGPGRPGVIHTEESDPAPDTIYARTKYEAEQIALAEHRGTTVLRLAAVYGPRMRGNYPLLVKAFRRGLAVMLGNGTNRRTLVHVADVARAAQLAATSEESIGRTYNVTDGSVHTFDEIARAIQAALGRHEGIRYLPAGPFRTALATVKPVADAAGLWRFPSPALVDKLTEDIAVSGELIQRELGFRPTFDLRSGWAQALASEPTPEP